MNKITNLIILIVLLPIVSVAQIHCGCCPSFDDYKEFQTYFPNELMKFNKIKSATIHYQHKVFEGSLKDDSPKKIHAKIQFTEEGFINMRQKYFSGKPQMGFIYERDIQNRIIKREYFFVDENGERIAYLPNSISDFYYNINQVKNKNRDLSGEILPDELSLYTLRTYDEKDRIKNVFSQIHIENPLHHSENTEEYLYNDETYQGVKIRKNDGKISSIDTITYTSDWQIISVVTYDSETKLHIKSIEKQYDSQLRIISSKHENDKSRKTKCRNGGNYELLYSYNEKGLLETMTYISEKEEIELTLSYEVN